MTRKTDEPEPKVLLQVPDLPEDDGKEQERAEERALFARYKAAPSERLEGELVEKFKPLVYRIVHKFRFNPDQFDDLVQVGTVGLLLAIRRFDLETGFRFSTYAWTTIQGEIQRYFRDKTWAVNVPRDLKEKSLKVFNARNEYINDNGHEPTVAELCRRTGFSDETIQEALELGSAYHPQSYMENSSEGDATYAMDSDGEGSETTDMGVTKRSIFWESLLGHLTDTEAKVVRMYFFDQLTQKEIADSLGTSQMNISRITRLALGKLRHLLVPEDMESLGTI